MCNKTYGRPLNLHHILCLECSNCAKKQTLIYLVNRVRATHEARGSKVRLPPTEVDTSPSAYLWR